MKSLAIILCLISLLRTGISIQCFKCSSRGQDQTCERVSRYKWTPGSSGAEGQQCYTSESVVGKYCIKAVGYVAGEWQVTRGCSVARMQRNGDFSFENNMFTGGRILSCDTDLCNASVLPKPGIFLMVIFALICIVIQIS